MKKLLIVVVLLAIAGVGVWKHKEMTPPGLPSGGEEVNKPVVKIGVILPLTGLYADLGKNAQAAIEMAVNRARPQNVDIDFIFEDYGYEAPRAALAAHKLIDADKVDAIVSWSSPAGGVVSPIADMKGIPHISITADKNIAKGGHNFIISTSSEASVEKMLELIGKQNPKTMAVFAAFQSSMQQTADLLEAQLKNAGIESERHNFNIDNKDLAMLIDSVKAKNYDLWYIGSLPPSLDVFLKLYHEKGVTVPLVAIDSFNFSQDKRLAEGMTYVSTAEANPQLLDEIKAKTNSDSFFNIGFIYDTGTILATVYDKLVGELGRVPTADEVAVEIKGVHNMNGAVGNISVSEDGIISAPAIVKIIKDGKPVVVEE